MDSKVDDSVEVAAIVMKEKQQKKLRKQSDECKRINDTELATKLEESKKNLLTKQTSLDNRQRREAVSEKHAIEREFVRLSVENYIREINITNSF